jgi:hypothetical protein
MAKKNVKTNNEMVEQPATEVQPVQKGTGDSNDTQTTTEQAEGSEKELHVQPEQGGGEQTNVEGNPGMDSEIQETATGTKGGETGDQTVNDNHDLELDAETKDAYQAAKEVITGMVDEALEESGILDEPKEKTGKRNKIADDVFSKHSQRKTLYFTSDMVPFFERSDAKKHAGTLKDDSVVTINKK